MFINLTPHAVQIFKVDQFQGLEQTNPTTWVADGVSGEPLLELPSSGVARIESSTVEAEPLGGIPMLKTEYGAAIGIPDSLPEDALLVVSLPMKSMAKTANHPLADRMVSPYQVVRLRSNGSVVLGATGFTY